MFGLFGNKDEEQPQEQQNPALAGFSRPVEYVKNFLKETFGGGLKGALIGAVALPVIAGAAVLAGGSSIPFGTLLLGGAALSSTFQGFLANQAIGLALNGALAGAGLGAVIKGGMAISNGEEAVDAAEQKLLFGAQRKAQMQANAAMVQQNLARAQGMGMQPQPQMSAMMQPQMQQFPPVVGMQPQQGQGFNRV